MSAHSTVTAIEQEAEAFCRRRYRDQAEYLEAKDAHCHRIRTLVRQLRPQIGTVEKQSFGASGVSGKGKPFVVARRARKGAVQAA